MTALSRRLLLTDLGLSVGWFGYVGYLDLAYQKSGRALIGGGKLWLTAQLLLLGAYLVARGARRVWPSPSRR